MRVKSSSVELMLHPALTNYLICVDRAYRSWDDDCYHTNRWTEAEAVINS